jgi:hypothetical protein
MCCTAPTDKTISRRRGATHAKAEAAGKATRRRSRGMAMAEPSCFSVRSGGSRHESCLIVCHTSGVRSSRHAFRRLDLAPQVWQRPLEPKRLAGSGAEPQREARTRKVAAHKAATPQSRVSPRPHPHEEPCKDQPPQPEKPQPPTEPPRHQQPEPEPAVHPSSEPHPARCRS